MLAARSPLSNNENIISSQVSKISLRADKENTVRFFISLSLFNATHYLTVCLSQCCEII